MKKVFLALLISFAVPALAQFTTVTGTVIDPHNVPYALGTITPTLVIPSGAGSPTLNGNPYSPPSSAVNLDKNGSFAFNVADNTMLLPAGTKWNFQVCSATGTVNPALGTGPQCFSLAAPITISGSTQSLSTQLNAVALALTIPLSSGGGNILPGTQNSQFPNWVPGTSSWTPQNKAIYDVRDWMTCDGVTNATAGMNNLLATIGSSEATVEVVGTCLLAVLHHPANVTFDFRGGGAIQLITNSTSPGSGAFVQGAGQSNAQASPTSTCSVTLTGTTATNSIVMAVAVYATFSPDNARINSVTDGKDLFTQQMQTTLGNAPYIAVYVASFIGGGTVTVSANLSHSEKNACIAWEVSGMGPVVATDNSTFNYGTTTPFSTGSATLAAGDFVAAFGEDPNGAQTCTAGAGYTQPASTAGNVSGTSGVSLCGEYIANGAGGSTSATQNFSSSPVASSWGAALIGLKPGTATWNALGGIIDPDLHQICINCTGTNGIFDFTGNTIVTNVYPEWWGACGSCSASTNTAAVQASEIGAFGTKRVNGSGLNQYNKVWTLTANYSINAEIKFYHVSGSSGSRAQVWCSAGGGLTQTATNLRILDGQSDAYLRFDNCSFIGNASSTGALTDFGYSAAQGVDFAPQFIDFYSVSWVGNNQVATGMLGAKEGGGAQFSNVYCYDCEVNGFTTSGWQIGTPTALAQNALDIGYCGDMQGNPQYGLANYGGGYITVGGGTCLTSMENGFNTQTGFDVYSSASQGPLVVEHYRSESRRLFFCSTCQIKDAFAINQSAKVVAGATQPVGTIMSGSQVGGDGAYYKVTVDGGPFGGTGGVQSQIIASGGSSTTVANTNQTLTGSVTIGSFATGMNETMTQSVTGATGVKRNIPANNATITGAASGAQIILSETMTQASTGVTCTEQPPTPVTGTSQNLICNNFSGTADASHAWTGGTSGGVYTPTAAPSFAAASPVLVLGSVTGSPDSSHNWTGGTSGGVYTPTQAPQSANYTVNAFTGMIASIFTGTNALCYGTVASNTSTVITVSAWITRYPGVVCPGPDSTSTFIVEPGWSHSGTVTSGGMQLQYLNETVIDGDNGASGTFEDVIGYGGQWHMAQAAATRTIIRHGQVSRQDWYTPIGATPQANSGTSLGTTNLGSLIDGDWDVGVFPPGADRPESWSNLTSGGAVMILNASRRNLGARAICWNAEGAAGGTTPANEVCVGGRSDPNATTDTFRSRFEIYNTIGAPAPVPTAGNGFSLTNIAGTDTHIGGGPSTGNATPGQVCFDIGSIGSSGSTVNTGTSQWCVNSSGNLIAQSAQTIQAGIYATKTNCAQSGTAANPSVVSCSAAPAGAVACSVSASAGTCVVNTTAVGANSQIIVQETTKENTRLGVTCNTSPTVIPAIIVASQVNGTSFTINMPTISTNPACFDYWIVNQ